MKRTSDGGEGGDNYKRKDLELGKRASNTMRRKEKPRRVH